MHSWRCGQSSFRPKKQWWPGTISTPRCFSRSYNTWLLMGRPSNHSHRKNAPSGLWMRYGRSPSACAERVDRLGRAVQVKRGHMAGRQRVDFTAAEQFRGDRRADVAAGQVDDAVGVGISVDDLFPRHDDTGAHARHAQLGQAQGQDGVVVPVRGRVGKQDIRKRQAVGAVENQRNVPFPCDFIQVGDFCVGQHVTGRVGGPGDTQGAGLVAHFQP